ncbi:MAG: hypothetical protein C0399_11160 [Syntrophus sp. (in: bacteria)]|nr:hypothetical protein [Syntrophus sp. (in: bacteria)]
MEGFFVLARKSRDCAEAHYVYAAQAKPQIDTARAEKNPFRTETKYYGCQYGLSRALFFSLNTKEYKWYK